METIAKYAYEVYKKGSFTNAAKSLYLSQPSLSAAISRLEAELGFRIFNRSTIPASLTAEGRIYIEALEEIMECEHSMKKRIRALSDVEHGSLTVGGSSYASYLILSEVCSAFYQANPKINVTLDIGNVGSEQVLAEKLLNNEIDIWVTYESHHPKMIVEPLLEERLVIAMHRGMKGAEVLIPFALTRDEILTKCYSPDREIEDMSIFRHVDFLEFSPKSDTTHRMEKILGSYKPSQYKIENARHSEMHYNLMCMGISAVMTTSLSIAQKPYDENILFFMPKSEESHRNVFLAYHTVSKHNPLIRSFLDTAKSIYF